MDIEKQLQNLVDKKEIQEVLIRYAQACDQRDWGLLQSVFTEDVSANYGDEFKVSGLGGLRDLIRSMLGGCGPSQHLLGNLRISVEGDAASCVCYVQAVHAGLGEKEDVTYEVWGEYRDKLIRTREGWRISDRYMHVVKELGTREILGPG